MTLVYKIVALVLLIAALVGAQLWFLHDAKATAYLQGMSDCAAAQQKADKRYEDDKQARIDDLDGKNRQLAAETAVLRQKLTEKAPVEVKYVRSVVEKYPIFAAVQRPDDLVRARSAAYAVVSACSRGDSAGCARYGDHGPVPGPGGQPLARAGSVGGR